MDCDETWVPVARHGARGHDVASPVTDHQSSVIGHRSSIMATGLPPRPSPPGLAPEPREMSKLRLRNPDIADIDSTLESQKAADEPESEQFVEGLEQELTAIDAAPAVETPVTPTARVAPPVTATPTVNVAPPVTVPPPVDVAQPVTVPPPANVAQPVTVPPPADVAPPVTVPPIADVAPPVAPTANVAPQVTPTARVVPQVPTTVSVETLVTPTARAEPPVMPTSSVAPPVTPAAAPDPVVPVPSGTTSIGFAAAPLADSEVENAAPRIGHRGMLQLASVVVLAGLAGSLIGWFVVGT